VLPRNTVVNVAKNYDAVIRFKAIGSAMSGGTAAGAAYTALQQESLLVWTNNAHPHPKIPCPHPTRNLIFLYFELRQDIAKRSEDHGLCCLRHKPSLVGPGIAVDTRNLWPKL
jgi:hypothetical protein